MNALAATLEPIELTAYIDTNVAPNVGWRSNSFAHTVVEFGEGELQVTSSAVEPSGTENLHMRAKRSFGHFREVLETLPKQERRGNPESILRQLKGDARSIRKAESLRSE